MFNRRNAPRRLSAMAGYIGLMRRAVVRGPRSSPVTVDFLRMDKALPEFIAFSRSDASPCATRRRIIGSVGPSRTNRIRFSSDLSNAAWNRLNGPTVTGNAATAPDGTMTAARLQAGAASSGIYQNNTLAEATRKTTSIYFKDNAGADKTVRIGVGGTAFGGDRTMTVNVETLAVTPHPSYDNVTVTPAALGFHRLSFSCTPSTTGSASLFVYGASSGIDILVWGAQMEDGDGVTPYIPTTDSAVTTTDWPRTNKCTNRNANPVDTSGLTKGGDAAATLTVVDDMAALEEAGLHGICTSGKVYKLDNSAGGSAAWAIPSGVVGNTGPHTASVYLRNTGATARLGLTANDGVGAFGPSSSYRRAQRSGITPTSAARSLQVTIDAGGIVYFILNQLEEGAAATAVIPNDTGAAKTVTTPPYGDLEVLAANKPRIEYTADGLPRGLLIEPSRTNKCTNDNTDPSATTGFGKSGPDAALLTLSVVEDAAALAAAGLPGSKVFKADGTAVTGVAYVLFPGQVGNTNPHVGSVYVRGGTGDLRDSTGSGIATFAASTTYVRRTTTTFTPGSATNTLAMKVDPGQVIYFILNQLEEASAASSVIDGNKTRAAESAVIASLASVNWNAGGWSAMVEWEVGANVPVGTSGRPLELSDGTTQNRVLVFHNGGSTLFYMVVSAGVTQVQAALGTAALGSIAKVALSVTPTGLVLSLNGAAPVSVAVAVPMSALSRMRLGGSVVPSNELIGYLRRFKAWNRALTQGELQEQSA